jgi:hypothetical protein
MRLLFWTTVFYRVLFFYRFIGLLKRWFVRHIFHYSGQCSGHLGHIVKSGMGKGKLFGSLCEF